MRSVRLETEHDVEFTSAQGLAARQALSHVDDPMLLAWLDRITGKHSPDVECCQEDGKETWEIYEESRGGSVRRESGYRDVCIFREGMKGI